MSAQLKCAIRLALKRARNARQKHFANASRLQKIYRATGRASGYKADTQLPDNATEQSRQELPVAEWRPAKLADNRHRNRGRSWTFQTAPSHQHSQADRAYAVQSRAHADDDGRDHAPTTKRGYGDDLHVGCRALAPNANGEQRTTDPLNILGSTGK